MAQEVTVNENDDGQRLDRWLKKNYPDTSFGDMQKILRTGQVRVDGKRAKGDTRLATGQNIRIPPQLTIPELQKAKKTGVSPKDEAFIKSLVIYEDAHLIALNKPAGLATQGGTKISKSVDQLVEALAVDGVKPHLVHRLDKDTSGVLLLARSAKAARAMGEVFKGREIRKYYWALVSPAPSLYQGKIRSAIAKVESGGGEYMMAVEEDHPDAKIALTYYTIMETLGSSLAWVAFWPRTGRTHQIRVHAADELGTPIIGDDKYDRDGVFLADNPEIADQLHLHARQLKFVHPLTGKKVNITAPLDQHMRKTFKHFGFDANDKRDPFEDLE